MIKKWAGKVWIDDGIAFYLGYIGDNHVHKHYAIQIVLSYEGVVSVFDESNQETRAAGIVIPSNIWHRVQADGEQKIALIYMEPHSESGRALMAQFSGKDNICQLTHNIYSACIRELDCIEQGIISGSCDIRNIVSLLIGVNTKPLVIDERVQRTMDYIRNHLEDIETLESLAGLLAISPRYLRRLFEQQVGMSLQRFRLWVKLQSALYHIAAGKSFTEAAYTADFTDSAHFSRTFRAMFGIAPSDVMSKASKSRNKQLTT